MSFLKEKNNLPPLPFNTPFSIVTEKLFILLTVLRSIFEVKLI